LAANDRIAFECSRPTTHIGHDAATNNVLRINEFAGAGEQA